MILSTPPISPQVTRQGIEELSNFPKIRDYDLYWEGLRRQLNPDIARIVKYGTARYEDRDYTLRAIEVGETGDPLFIVQAGTHGYEMSGPRAINQASSQQSFLRASTSKRILIVPIAQPRAFEHDLRYVVGQNCNGDLTITDTNRDFFLDAEKAETEESKHLISYYQAQQRKDRSIY